MTALRVVLVSYPLALFMIALAALVAGGQVSRPAMLWGALAGLSQAIGVWWFYAALAAGPISVVSPLTAVLAASVPVCVGLASGERPGVVAGVGVVLAMAAVVLVSRDAGDEDVRPHRFTRSVAWLTVGCGVALGTNYVLLAQVPSEARLWPLVFARTAATAVVFVLAALRSEFQAPKGVPLRLAVAAGLFDTIANVTMLLALQSSMLALAGVLMSLYPAATVLLAIVVLRERVTARQLTGMGLAVTAVAMITVR